ncbi:MAG TPA: RNA polymerase sigma factor SigJ [Nocardioides sp.]|jgi:RNA polymerase sigma-70 factor (ECF subfamily)|nr:RNA polymerase sigma factor SigJ [Nocardioides sp.]
MAEHLDSGMRAENAGSSMVMDERPRLLNIAYRALGSLAEAEDAVQEAYARWYGLSGEAREAISSPGAWLTTVTSRICLDVLRSARVRRERYVGEWVPEPLPDRTEWGGRVDVAPDPVDRITLDESVDMAFMVLLDSMTPAERVSFLLHDVFRYPFAEIGRIVGRTPAACRQLAASARRRIEKARPPAVPPPRRAGIIKEFKRAWEAKDIGALINVLDPDATVIADGGGVVPASLMPIEGAERIAHYLVQLANVAGDVTLTERTVNGQPGLVARHDGVTATVFAFDIRGDRIQRVWAIRNPDKLRPWNGA